jgi:prepilin-type N-terminal cleavage/methylation domain-containing protein
MTITRVTTVPHPTGKSVSGPKGFSMAEIIIAISVFGVAVAGLFFALQTVERTIVKAIDRDIEAAYVNMKVAEVNPSRPDMEAYYDLPTKTALNLPNNRTVYYSRLVSSSATTPDLKNVDIYLYRKSSSTTPYRQFRREIAPYAIGYNLGEATSYLKDSQGRVWAPGNGNVDTTVSGNDTDRADGICAGAWTTANYSTATAIGNTPDQAIFQKGHTASNASNGLCYDIYASQNRSYILRLGFAEIDNAVTSGQRKMKILVNGTQVDSVDPVVDAGGTFKALVKTYTVTPGVTLNGANALEVKILQDTGATQQPRLAFIGLERKNL